MKCSSYEPRSQKKEWTVPSVSFNNISQELEDLLLGPPPNSITMEPWVTLSIQATAPPSVTRTVESPQRGTQRSEMISQPARLSLPLGLRFSFLFFEWKNKSYTDPAG